MSRDAAPPTPEVVAAAARCIERAGGGAALGRAVGVSRYAVHLWARTGIPAHRAGLVSRVTGIPLHEVRPDLFDPPGAATPPEPARPAA